MGDSIAIDGFDHEVAWGLSILDGVYQVKAEQVCIDCNVSAELPLSTLDSFRSESTASMPATIVLD